MSSILAFFFLAICGFANAKMTIETRSDFYEVSGNDAQALVSSMKQQRYLDHNFFTKWHVYWDYEFLTKNEERLLQSFSTRVHILYTFPKWVRPKGANPKLANEWKRYMEATTVHERGHSALATSAAKEMVRLIKSKKWSAATRSELQASIDKECQAIVEQYKLREINYDKETDHGRTQGARLRIE